MPTNTPNYGLIKPAEDEFYDINQFNQNADIIDTQIKAVNTRVDNSGMSIHGNEFHEPDMALASELTTHANLTTAHSAVATPTANRLMLRDANGRAQVAAPAVAADIARLDTVTTHAAQSAAGTHGSAVTATPNTLIHRDANGRAQVADGVAAGDIASFAQVNNLRTLIRMGAM